MAPHGVRGWVKLRADFGPPDLLVQVAGWLLKAGGHDGGWRPTRADDYRLANGRMMAKLPGIDGRDQARELVGTDIGVYRQEMPELPAGEYYWCDLVGLSVLGAGHQRLGKVVRIIPTRAHDVIEISSQNGDLLVPFKDRYITEVNLAEGVLKTTWREDY